MSEADYVKETTKIAYLLCKESGMTKALWELFLPTAYDLYCLEKEPARTEKLEEIGYKE